MSWSFHIPKTPKGDEFNAAVDAAEATGQPAETPGLAEDVSAAKEATKAVGAHVKRGNLSASVSGHCLSAKEGASVHDGITIQVHGID